MKEKELTPYQEGWDAWERFVKSRWEATKQNPYQEGTEDHYLFEKGWSENKKVEGRGY